jgi:hypothetical protein
MADLFELRVKIDDKALTVTDQHGRLGALGLLNGWLNRWTSLRIAAVYDDAGMLTGVKGIDYAARKLP